MRNSRKKALYEVIIKSRSKTDYEQLHPKNEPEEAVEQNTRPDKVSSRVVRWINKPRFVQFNAGRIEFSIPLQLGIAIGLGAILLILLSFRLGQNFADRRPASIAAVKESAVKPAVNRPAVNETTIVKQPSPVKPAVVEQTPSTGKNRIVIQTYQVKSHLEPVKSYFDKMGVATEIIEKDNWFYLVTKNKYDSIDKPGSSGYLAKQKIIELGAGYKAPPGNESFGPKPFSDAFGMKFDE